MLVKGRCLKITIKLFFLIIVFLISKTVFADNTKTRLLNYNKSLDNSSALFIQSDGENMQEGIIYIGSKRIRVEYINPQKITIVISKNRGMYVNYELMETEYFNTNKSLVKIFYKIFMGDNFFKNSSLEVLSSNILIKDSFEIDDNVYKIEIIYENNPLKIRKVKVKENNQTLEIGFYNHNKSEQISKDFFSLINPFLNN